MFKVEVGSINNMLVGIVVVINGVLGNLGISVMVINGMDGVYFVFVLLKMGLVNVISVVVVNVVNDSGLLNFGVMLMVDLFGGVLKIDLVNGVVVWW